MNVILHKDRLAKDRQDVLLLLPKRIAVSALPFFVPQFRKGSLDSDVQPQNNQPRDRESFTVGTMKELHPRELIPA